MKRSSIQRRTPLKRTPFVAKRRKADIPTATRKAVADRSEGLCEVRVPEVCTNVATEIDHIKNRSQGGGHEMSNLSAICHDCHLWKGLNPDAAHELGIYKRGWE